ncbi:response regulator transcription factor [Streptomyces sp. DH37]|uniref:response regulator transcription factor n=1 Tax=Streptomyces sp. DH37 TaxID=3040122 RepID=UPI0024419988|nr:helix-turn-helix transcriptional regulator [Streptomyces sp. DH37]MDG9703744.1 LuxR C-terminal-related transcriptional regulator [Streptomyces sp. DH37]
MSAPLPRMLMASMVETARQHQMRVSPPELHLLARAAAQVVMTETAQRPPAPPVVSEAGKSAPVQGMVTARQMAVLRLVANGYENEQIAHLLGISLHSARSSVSRAYRRLGATSRAHAVAIAMARGLIDPADIDLPPLGHKPGRRPAAKAVA